LTSSALAGIVRAVAAATEEGLDERLHSTPFARVALLLAVGRLLVDVVDG
jgi:hypothetical protein